MQEDLYGKNKPPIEIIVSMSFCFHGKLSESLATKLNELN